MYCLNSNETPGEKAWWELHKNAMCCFEQILGEGSHKTATVRPPAFYLTNHPNNPNKTCWILLVKWGRRHKRHSPEDSYTWIHVGRPAKTYISSRYRLEDLPGAIDNRNKWWEKEKESGDSVLSARLDNDDDDDYDSAASQQAHHAHTLHNFTKDSQCSQTSLFAVS